MNPYRIPRTFEIKLDDLLANSRQQIVSARRNLIISRQLVKRARVLMTIRRTVLAFKKARA